MSLVRLTTLVVCALVLRASSADGASPEPRSSELGVTPPGSQSSSPTPAAASQPGAEPADREREAETSASDAATGETDAAQPSAPALEPDPAAPSAGSTAPEPSPPSPGDPTDTSTSAPPEAPPPWLALESRGELGFEARRFWPDDTDQTRDGNGTMVGRLHVDAATSHVTGKARVFGRLDAGDRERSVLIAEELWIELRLPCVRLRAGHQMINWTATEAFHPADVINSRYLDSAIENPEKLGEPMASLRVEIPHGSVDAMFMPVFVAPIFPSARSRQRFVPPGLALAGAMAIGHDGDVLIERSPLGSPGIRFAPQGALRVQQTWGSADVSVHGLAHVDRSYPGVAIDPATGAVYALFLPVLQSGGTYQQALGAWLLKLEAAYRWYRRPDGGRDPFGAVIPDRDHFVAAAGVEYGLPHANGSESTLLLEGQVFVPRQRSLPDQAKPLFQNDVLAGIRHAFNDEASRALTLVAIVDVLRPQELFVNGGYAQRLGETWTVQVGLRFVRVPPRDPANPQLFEWLNNSHQAYANLFRHF